MTKQKQIQNEPLTRTMTFERSSINEETRVVEVAFSSETPVSRWFGDEVLDHGHESVDLSRLNNAGALLWQHDPEHQIGVVESAWIDNDRVGRATVRFSKSKDGDEVFQDVLDGIRRHISVGYRINKYEVTETEGNPDLIRVTRWVPYEISVVSIPADNTVGVGRSEDFSNFVIEQDIEMPKENIVENQERSEAVVAPSIINVDEVRQQERARVAEITKAANASPMGIDLTGLRDQAIDSGMSVNEFRSAAFDLVASQPQSAQVRASEEMFQREEREYSLARAINAQISGDWSDAGFEREMSQELQRNGASVVGGGLIVPVSVFTRSSDRTNNAALIGTKHMANQFIDVLRANTLMGKLGARFLTGLQGNLSIPKKTASAQFGWLAEKEEAAASEVTTGNIGLTPRHIGGLVPMTFELMRQSSPVIEQIVREDILTGMGLAIDHAAFNGTGANNQPLGLLNQSGIHTLTFKTAAAPSFDEMVAMEGLLDEANALMGSLHYAMRPSLYSVLKTTKKDAGSGLFVAENGYINGYKGHSSTQMPAGTILFGNFSDVMIGTWGTVELIPTRNGKTGGLDIGVHQLADVAIRHPESFVKAGAATKAK